MLTDCVRNHFDINRSKRTVRWSRTLRHPDRPRDNPNDQSINQRTNRYSFLTEAKSRLLSVTTGSPE